MIFTLYSAAHQFHYYNTHRSQFYSAHYEVLVRSEQEAFALSCDNIKHMIDHTDQNPTLENIQRAYHKLSQASSFFSQKAQSFAQFPRTYFDLRLIILKDSVEAHVRYITINLERMHRRMAVIPLLSAPLRPDVITPSSVLGTEVATVVHDPFDQSRVSFFSEDLERPIYQKYQETFPEIENLIAQGNYIEAENLIDTKLSQTTYQDIEPILLLKQLVCQFMTPSRPYLKTFEDLQEIIEDFSDDDWIMGAGYFTLGCILLKNEQNLTPEALKNLALSILKKAGRDITNLGYEEVALHILEQATFETLDSDIEDLVYKKLEQYGTHESLALLESLKEKHQPSLEEEKKSPVLEFLTPVLRVLRTQ